MNRLRLLLNSVLPVAVLFLTAATLSAQETGVGRVATQSLRPYWHVFLAYAVVIVLILGWVVSIARRLAAMERRLAE